MMIHLLALFHLAQSGQDIASVPAEFVKNFLIMFGFVTVGAGAYIFGRRGSKGSPIHLDQPIDVNAKVKEEPVFAHQTALDKLRADMEARTRENLRQHDESAKQLAAVIEAGNARLQSMLTALHDMENRMTKATLTEIRGIHERINPIAELVSGQKSDIKGINDRIGHLWEMIQSLWAQVFAKPAPRK